MLMVIQKVRNHCHITRKYRVSSHRDCNINFKSNHKIPIVFHNLKNYNFNLIMQELAKFSLKINDIPNGLEKYMSFNINKKFIFIDSSQFISSSLDSLVKNFNKNDFKCLSQEFDNNILDLVKQKGFCPYDYISAFEKSKERLPGQKKFYSSLTGKIN